jgi:hypothetical protein
VFVTTTPTRRPSWSFRTWPKERLAPSSVVPEVVVVAELPFGAVGTQDDDFLRLALVRDRQVGTPAVRPDLRGRLFAALLAPQHAPNA